MRSISEVDSLLFGLTPDQWTEINGLASSITAVAAVLGVLLAAVAVFVSRRSVLIDRRTYLDSQFHATLDVVVRFGALADRLQLGGAESVQLARADGRRTSVRDQVNELYGAMQSAKLAIRRFEGGGLPRWDATRPLRGRRVNLAGAMRALELAHDFRYVAIQVESGELAAADAVRWLVRGDNHEEVLGSFVDAVCAYLGLKVGAPRYESIRAAFQEALDWGISNDTDERGELARQVFDHVLAVVQECYDDASHRVARWSVAVPSVKRGLT